MFRGRWESKFVNLNLQICYLVGNLKNTLCPFEIAVIYSSGFFILGKILSD